MKSPINVDIVIVGAGLSGLVAAHTILKHDPDLKIVILEAKDRIGGRILSVPIKVTENTCNIDVGGHWISSEQRLLLNLLCELKLTLVSQCKSVMGLVDIGYSKTFSYSVHPIVGNLFTKLELSNFFMKMDQLSENYSFTNLCNTKIKNYYYDSITMDYYIRKQLYTKVARKIANTIIKTSCGLEPSQISLLNYLVFCNGTQGFTNQYMMNDGGTREYWIEEGAQELCTRLAQTFDTDTVLTKCPVSSIVRTNKYVIIDTLNDLYKCQYTIIAIPPKQILDINFTPNLSTDRYRILLQNENKHLKKFVISYKEKFWEKHGCSGQVFNCEGHILFCFDATVKKYPILMGYIDINSCDCEESTCKRSVINQLEKYWGKEAKDPIDYVEKVWSEEKYNGSCPTSRPFLNNMYYCNQLVEPLGRIYWAGTETADVWNGFMEGAVQAGYRASLEIIYHLRPQSITLNDVIQNEYKHNHKKRIVGNWYLSLYNPYLFPIVVGTALLGIFIYHRKYY